jgi:hypothetical protein
MKNEFIPYGQALALKELGFNEPCLAFWDGKNTDAFYFNNIRDASGDYTPFQKHDRLKWFGAPLYQQVFRWFREKHGMLGCIEFVEPEYGGDYGYKLYYKPGHLHIDHWNKGFKSYEEAEQACLDKLIEICKKK